jgi:DNA repair protein RecN (Recombination protein N)
MLDELAVRNLGIISDARIEPVSGFVVVTGETGAGKTMLLGALRLLIGEPARTDLIGPDGDEAVVDGRFIADGVETTVSRRITSGRSRAYLDGSMAPAKAIGERVGALVEIVGQHDQLALTHAAELRALVDTRLESNAPREAYQAAWERLHQVEVTRRQLGGDQRALERELDLLTYQVEEIAGSGFESGDDTRLEQEAARLGNADDLKLALGTALDSLDSADDGVGVAVSEIRKAMRFDAELSGIGELAESVAADLNELARMVRDALDRVEDDPEALAEAEQRLGELGQLRRKYGATLDAVLAFGIEAGLRRDELETMLARAETVDRDHEEAVGAVTAAGAALRDARRAAGERLVSAAAAHLAELGFSDPFLAIEVREAPPGPSGSDRIELQFASDSRLTPGPVSRVASGGELSRLVLSLRLAGGAAAAPIVAFDEIDAGVGGETALAMGRKLAALAAGRQVLCVTHLPQVAAFADQHIVVTRTGTGATVATVEGEARLEELSRMLSGLPDSDQGRAHAQELRDLARASRPEE